MQLHAEDLEGKHSRSKQLVVTMHGQKCIHVSFECILPRCFHKLALMFCFHWDLRPLVFNWQAAIKSTTQRAMELALANGAEGHSLGNKANKKAPGCENWQQQTDRMAQEEGTCLG